MATSGELLFIDELLHVAQIVPCKKEKSNVAMGPDEY